MGRGVPRYVMALLLAVFLIGSGTAWGYSAFGNGATSCGAWTEAKAEASGRDRRIYHAWVNGYLTAYGFWVEDRSSPLSLIEPKGALAWIDNYCQENPLKAVAHAARMLIDAIKAK